MDGDWQQPRRRGRRRGRAGAAGAREGQLSHGTADGATLSPAAVDAVEAVREFAESLRVTAFYADPAGTFWSGLSRRVRRCCILWCAWRGLSIRDRRLRAQPNLPSLLLRSATAVLFLLSRGDVRDDVDNSSRASRALLPRPEHGCACFDPAFDASDCALLRRFGISVIDRNEECRRSVRAHQDPSSPAPRTLFFMVHCSRQMYSNVLSANWRASDLVIAIVGNSFERYGLFEQDGARSPTRPASIEASARVVVAGTASRRQNVSRHDAPYSLVDPGMIYSAFNDTSFISVDSAVSTMEAEDQFAQDNVPKPAMRPWRWNHHWNDPRRRWRAGYAGPDREIITTERSRQRWGRAGYAETRIAS